MAVIHNPPAPWAGPYPQEVTDNYGNTWVATAPYVLKKPSTSIETPDDCCLYLDSSNRDLVRGEEPRTPTFSPDGKSDGDTLIQKHPNGESTWLCQNGDWIFQWLEISSACDNPLVSRECSLHGIINTYCDGTQTHEMSQHLQVDERMSDGDLPPIEPSTPLGAIGPLLPVTLPETLCPGSVRLRTVHSMVEGGQDADGLINLRVYYSTDGGATFSAMSEGGFDVATFGTGVTDTGEYEFSNETVVEDITEPGQQNTIFFQLFVDDNDLNTGSVDINRADFSADFISTICCEA